MKTWLPGLAALLLAAGGAGADESWTEFRGPGGTGHSGATGLPREWSETKNVVWKAPIHGKGWSSPVVWGKQVWLTTATPEGRELFAMAFDLETGKVLHDLKVFETEKPDDLTPKYNSFASPTPVLEEGRVYVHYGTYGTACIATDSGKILWARRDLNCVHWRGAGSSPIVFKNLLILHFDGHDQQYLVGLDKKTGQTVWKSKREHDFRTKDGDMMKGFATPTVIDVGGRPVLVSPASAGTLAYDPMTGKELWRVQHEGHSPAARPLFSHGAVLVTLGNSGKLAAIRPDGKGDVSASHVAWKAGGAGHKPSSIVVGDLVYLLKDIGVVTCVDAKTGQEVWNGRLGTGEHSASPIYADGVLYFVSHAGGCAVVQPGREFKLLAKNQLEGHFRGTPAVAGKSLLLRSETNLYRIEGGR
jgi:outer membrane protein assembly factor BamB